MNTNNLFIPKKIKAGFQTRTDTYTGKLAYVIGHDGIKWRKEKSWSQWKVDVIQEEDYDKLKRKDWDDRYDYLKKLYNNHKGLNYLSKYTADQIQKYTEEEYININLKPYDEHIYYNNRITADVSLTPIEYDNIPTEGFVLNRKAGGYSSGWNHRNSVCRIYDPRGFEIEISVENLLFILEHCDCNKGKGLEGEFVYSWDKAKLVLLPVSSDEFKSNKQK
jgi:hypothetical protein